MLNTRQKFQRKVKIYENGDCQCKWSWGRIIEKWGTGIPRILRECVEYGLPEPKLIDFDGDFRVNMYRKQKNESILKTTQTKENPTQSSVQPVDFQFTKKDREILKVIRKNPGLTQREIALELGWTVDRVKYYLNKMKKKQVIKRVGSRHKGYWKILAQNFLDNKENCLMMDKTVRRSTKEYTKKDKELLRVV